MPGGLDLEEQRTWTDENGVIWKQVYDGKRLKTVRVGTVPGADPLSQGPDIRDPDADNSTEAGEGTGASANPDAGLGIDENLGDSVLGDQFAGMLEDQNKLINNVADNSPQIGYGNTEMNQSAIQGSTGYSDTFSESDKEGERTLDQTNTTNSETNTTNTSSGTKEENSNLKNISDVSGNRSADTENQSNIAGNRATDSLTFSDTKGSGSLEGVTTNENNITENTRGVSQDERSFDQTTNVVDEHGFGDALAGAVDNATQGDAVRQNALQDLVENSGVDAGYQDRMNQAIARSQSGPQAQRAGEAAQDRMGAFAAQQVEQGAIDNMLTATGQLGETGAAGKLAAQGANFTGRSASGTEAGTEFSEAGTNRTELGNQTTNRNETFQETGQEYALNNETFDQATYERGTSNEAFNESGVETGESNTTSNDFRYDTSNVKQNSESNIDSTERFNENTVVNQETLGQTLGQLFGTSIGNQPQGGGGGGCCFIFLEARYGNGVMDKVVRRYRDEHMTPRNRRGYYKLAQVLVPIMRKSKLAKLAVRLFMTDPMVSYGKYFYEGRKLGKLATPIAKFWLRVFDWLGQDHVFVRETGEIV